MQPTPGAITVTVIFRFVIVLCNLTKLLNKNIFKFCIIQTYEIKELSLYLGANVF